MSDFFEGKSILVTGGTGSFGRQFVHTLMKTACKKIIIFSRDEWKQWEMQSTPLFQDPRLRFFLGDVRDVERLKRAFQDVDYLVHAAALKQVPAAEYNPSEFVKTNILGAMNVINASLEAGVKKVIALSSDKAVNPVNLYGATKLSSDKLFIAGNSYVGKRNYPIFSVVRYGNVLGSRGSVLLHWKNLMEDHSSFLPITHPEMTRFWIHLKEAAQFVIDSFHNMVGGEIFVPKIPSMKLTEMAKALAPHMEQKIIGLRPGEKIHETLISEDDAYYTYEFPKYFAILPADKKNLILEKMEKEKNFLPKEVAPHFRYRSDENHSWLSSEQFLSYL